MKDINSSDDELSEVQKDMSPKAIKKRKIVRNVKIWGGIVGFLVLILICIFIIQPAKTVTFNSGIGTKVESQTINLLTGHIKEPNNPTSKYCTFEGWYIRDDFSGSSVDFDTFKFTKDTTLFAKWHYNKYNITYYEKNEDTNEWVEIYSLDNPNYYTVKHEATKEELDDYHEQLRKQYIEEYGTNIDKYAGEIMDKLTEYKNNLQKGSLTLISPTKTIAGTKYTSVWKNNPNNEGDSITTISCLEPIELSLYCYYNY